jgi:hypothetical protein
MGAIILSRIPDVGSSPTRFLGCQTLKLDIYVDVIRLTKQDAGGRTPLPPPKAHSLRSWSLPA